MGLLQIWSDLRVHSLVTNEDFLFPIDSLSADPLFEDEYDWYVRPECRAVGMRGQRISLDLSAAALAERGLDLLDPPNVDPVVVMRSLLPDHRILLLASPEELKVRNKADLPAFIRLDEWFHPDLAEGEFPSACQTFQMLAEAIATGDPGVYKPSGEPNTHCRNWRDGGTL